MKRGLSHIETVLAFVIFIGFLIFAFFFFSPFTTNRVLDSTLTYALNEIKNNASVEVEIYSVILNEPHSELVGVSIDTGILNSGARVENHNGVKLSSYYDGNIVYLDPLGERFISVKFSEEFSEGDSSNVGQILDEEQYSISSSSKKSFYSEERLKELKNTYESDYLQLKKYFNLPNRMDFSFSVNSGNLSIIAEREIPEGIEVFSESNRIQLVKETGEMVFADMTVRVW